jgi:hypothetical protein
MLISHVRAPVITNTDVKDVEINGEKLKVVTEYRRGWRIGAP